MTELKKKNHSFCSSHPSLHFSPPLLHTELFILAKPCIVVEIVTDVLLKVPSHRGDFPGHRRSLLAIALGAQLALFL